MRLFILTIILAPVFCFGQTKVKEKQKVSYSVFSDKDGIEKKRKKNFVSNITKYDTLGNEIEFIQYGEVGHTYTENSVGCAWNYKNIKYSKKYAYVNGKRFADTTYYYKDNKVDYLSSIIEYIYDDKGVLMREEEFNGKKEIQNTILYKYNANSLISRKIEIKFEYSTIPKADTTTTEFLYDNKNRLVKEASKTKNFSWSREYDFDERLKIKRKYYFDNLSKFPYSVDYISLDDKGNPLKIEGLGFSFSTLMYTTTELTYDKSGLIMSEGEIPNDTRCDMKLMRSLTVYEYDYFK